MDIYIYIYIYLLYLSIYLVLYRFMASPFFLLSDDGRRLPDGVEDKRGRRRSGPRFSMVNFPGSIWATCGKLLWHLC